MWENLLPIIVTGLITGAIAWGGIHVELRYMRRDIDRLENRLNALQKEFHSYNASRHA